MRIKSVMACAILLLVLSLLFSSQAKLAFSEDTGPIKIGVITDLSGALANYGEMEVNGLYLGIEYATGGTFKVLGRDIQIIVEDDVGNPTQAASKATKLILQDGVDFLQGCASSACASAVQAVAAQYGVIFMVAPAADEKITGEGYNRYTFRTASSTWHDAFAGGAFAATYLGKTFAFLAPDYSWGYSTVKCWKYVIEKYGGQVIHVEYAPTTTVNFAPYLNRIISAAPDCFIPVWSGTGAMYLFDAMEGLKIYEKMNVTSGIGDLFSLQFLDVAINFTGMTKYAYLLPNNTVNDWLVNTWRAKYDAGTLPRKTSMTLPVPDLFVESAFAAGQAIVYAIQQAGTTNTETLISTLEGLNFTGPKGNMYIRPEDHQALQSMYIAQVFNDTTSWITNYYPNGFINLRLIAEIPPEFTAPPIRGDITPPTIANVVTTPGIPTIIDDVNVTATITDDLTGVKNASVYYSIDSGLNWSQVPMQSIGGSTYKATIPKQTNGTVVQYYINATDIALNTNQSAIYTYTVADLPKYYLTISVQPANGGTTNPPAGTVSYTEGENATVTVTATEGFEFDYWELDGVKINTTATTYVVPMYANHTLVAYMKVKQGIPTEWLIGGAVAGIAIIVLAVVFLKKRK
ncbi:MAG: ABC transporter substrate-binding protein [Candidatus Bathyarchaeia archaeon]